MRCGIVFVDLIVVDFIVFVVVEAKSKADATLKIRRKFDKEVRHCLLLCLLLLLLLFSLLVFLLLVFVLLVLKMLMKMFFSMSFMLPLMLLMLRMLLLFSGQAFISQNDLLLRNRSVSRSS